MNRVRKSVWSIDALEEESGIESTQIKTENVERSETQNEKPPSTPIVLLDMLKASNDEPPKTPVTFEKNPRRSSVKPPATPVTIEKQPKRSSLKPPATPVTIEKNPKESTSSDPSKMPVIDRSDIQSSLVEPTATVNKDATIKETRVSRNPSRKPFTLTRAHFMRLWKLMPLLCGIFVAVLLGSVALAAVTLLWINKNTTTTTLTTSPPTTSPLRTIVFSGQFVTGTIPTAACSLWTTFTSQLTNRSYVRLTISGTYDITGVSLFNSTIISNIANALRTTTAYGPVTSNGRSWHVGSCGIPYGLSASGSLCSCLVTGYMVRPCIGSSSFGGVNTTTCSSPSQNMTVTFSY